MFKYPKKSKSFQTLITFRYQRKELEESNDDCQKKSNEMNYLRFLSDSSNIKTLWILKT